MSNTVRKIIIESKMEVLERIKAQIDAELDVYRNMLQTPTSGNGSSDEKI